VLAAVCWLLAVVYLVDYVVYWPLAVANGLDTALHITVLLHGIYVGVIATWLHWHDQTVGSHWHVQMLN
jgi:threonine/homoserine efflux transporter RhtA